MSKRVWTRWAVGLGTGLVILGQLPAGALPTPPGPPVCATYLYPWWTFEEEISKVPVYAGFSWADAGCDRAAEALAVTAYGGFFDGTDSFDWEACRDCKGVGSGTGVAYTLRAVDRPICWYWSGWGGGTGTWLQPFVAQFDCTPLT